MRYREIIHDAWEFTQSNKRLVRWYAFWPSLLSTIVGIFYAIYQFYAFKSSPIFENWNRSFFYETVNYIGRFVATETEIAIPLMTTVIVVLVLYFVLPVICQGALIQIIARRYNGQKIYTLEGLKYGFLSFLPLLQYQMLIKTFSLLTLYSSAATLSRTLGIGFIYTLWPLYVFLAIVGIVLTLLFTYSEFYIVIDSEPVTQAMAKSTRLVVSHWQMTFLMAILMFIIGIRIIVQILLVLLVPLLVVATASYLATVTLAETGLYVGGIIGVVALLFAAYLGGIIHVFADAVWTFTFLELSGEEEVSAREVAPEQA